MIDRTIAPAFVKIPTISLQEAETKHLNDIPVHYIKAGTQEVVKVEAVFNAGKWFESANGVAYFTSKMLREGTASKSSRQIAELLDQKGAHLELSSTLDFAKVSLFCMSKHLEELIPLLLELVSEPTFPAEQLENIKKIESQQLEIDLLKPRVQAHRDFRKTLFPGSNYGISVDIDHIQTITKQQVEQHFEHHYKNAEFFVAGQFNEDILFDLLKSHPFKGKLNLTKDQTYSNSYQSKKITKDIEGGLQQSLRIGFPTINRGHPDYVNFKILNHALGGYFGSRLMKNIREEKGFTYGIYSSLIPMQHDCYFMISADVVKESSDEAVAEILNELKRLKTEIMPLEELETVKNHIAGSFQNDITSAFSLIDKFKSVYLFNQNYSHYSSFFQRLESITPEELQSLAAKYFVEDDLTIVQVG